MLIAYYYLSSSNPLFLLHACLALMCIANVLCKKTITIFFLLQKSKQSCLPFFLECNEKILASLKELKFSDGNTVLFLHCPPSERTT